MRDYELKKVVKSQLSQEISVEPFHLAIVSKAIHVVSNFLQNSDDEVKPLIIYITSNVRSLSTMTLANKS